MFVGSEGPVGQLRGDKAVSDIAPGSWHLATLFRCRARLQINPFQFGSNFHKL